MSDAKKYKTDAEALVQRTSERPLDPAAMADVFHVTHAHPTILKCANQFNSLILCRPFKVNLKSFPAATASTEFQRHITQYWMPWVRSLFLWRQMYGIVPWRVMAVEGDSRFCYPEIPDFDAGYITTWLDQTTHQQRFNYYWNNQIMASQQPAPMFWSHSEWQPTSSGVLRSPIHSVSCRI
jgi:hypothetical protein